MTTTPHRPRDDDEERQEAAPKNDTLAKGESVFSLFFTLVFVCASAVLLTLGILHQEPMTTIAAGLFAVAAAIFLGATHLAEAIRLCKR